MQKNIGFIGYVNKSEFLINLAKVLKVMKKKVLVIDSTIDKKMKYTIPTFDCNADKMLITFDGIDFATGFKSLTELKEYICENTSTYQEYDYVLIDVDNAQDFDLYINETFDKLYYFMEYSVPSLRHNEQLISHMAENNKSDDKLQFTKVVFKSYISRASKRFFEDKLYAMNIEFKDEEYEFEYNDQDKIADTETELSGYIDIMRHTKQFITLVTDMAGEIVGEVQAGDIRKALKSYSRGRL